MISETFRTAPSYLSGLFRNGTPAALTDSELLDRFTAGRDEHDETAEMAFAALLARHGPMVLRVCRAVLGDRHAAEDAFQATFLVLAVRARSIRRRGSVASWLHGVALRVAAAERSRSARRRRHELVRAMLTSLTTEDAEIDPVCDHELKLVIHEEIDRLPERHRAAVVLCYLEGLTHEMAAERLGWPVGTVKSRLTWARKRLCARLTRRGVAPTNLPIDRAGSLRNAEPAPLLLVARLADSTLRGALKAGTGKGAITGIVSAEAVALMEGTIKSLTSIRLALIATVVLVGGLVTAGMGVIGYSAIGKVNPRHANTPGEEPRQGIADAQLSQGEPRAAAKPATEKGPLAIRVEVVDPQGHRLTGADVVCWAVYPRNSRGADWDIKETRTDADGRVQIEVARERMGAALRSASVWAYQPGRALATSSVFLRGKDSPQVIPVTLGEPANQWSVIVLGADDQPMAGLRLAPRMLEGFVGRQANIWTVPDALFAPLTVTTDAKGVAKLTYLPQTMTPRSIQIGGPGVAPHTLKVDAPQGKDIILKLARSGRLVGIVRTASGQPLADVPVDVWVRGTGTWSVSGHINQRATPDSMVRLDPHPLKTGPQGAFQTAPVLLNGLTYRVSIRRDGFVPFVSDWVTLNGERAAIPAVRLQPLLKLTGQINDRQGRAVAGARVYLPAGGPRATADGEGRFALDGIRPGRTVVLVEHPGFRLQGWLADRSSAVDFGALTLVRASESPGSVMRPLADSVAPAEAGALADRLLEPFVQDAVEHHDEGAQLSAISAFVEFDVDRALELFRNGNFREENRQYQSTREMLAAKLAISDPARAEALVDSIPDALTKVSAWAGVARALPASERVRKQAVLERATAQLKDLRQQANATRLLRLVAEIAGQWLDMGDRDRARAVLHEGKISRAVFETGFLGQLARLEPDKALAGFQELPAPIDPSERNRELVEIASLLAIEHPAMAEQVFNLREAGSDPLPSLPYTLRLCRRLARIDPTRAGRVASSLAGPGLRACAWAYVSLGLAEKDKTGASAAMDRAIQEIDRLRESGPGLEPVTVVGGSFMYATNPAAVIVPIVERIAPERLDEVFWRAVALYPLIERDREDLLRSPYIGYECTLLARYDRQVAGALLAPIDSYLRSLAAGSGPRDEFDPGVIAAMGCIDGQSALSLVESLAPPGGSRRFDPAHQARLKLAEVLVMSPENRWIWLWRSVGAQLDD